MENVPVSLKFSLFISPYYIYIQIYIIGNDIRKYEIYTIQPHAEDRVGDLNEEEIILCGTFCEIAFCPFKY